MGASHEFVHLASAGDLEAAEQVLDQLSSFLDRAYDDGRILGYYLDILESDADCEREGIRDHWKALPGARYPITYLFVTPLDGWDTIDPVVGAELQRLGYVLTHISAPS